MSRTTKTINLVLISSSLILYGCGHPKEKEKEEEEKAAGVAGQRPPGRSHYFPIYTGGSRPAAGGTSASKGGSSVTPRGGFGSTGRGISVGG